MYSHYCFIGFWFFICPSSLHSGQLSQIHFLHHWFSFPKELLHYFHWKFYFRYHICSFFIKPHYLIHFPVFNLSSSFLMIFWTCFKSCILCPIEDTKHSSKIFLPLDKLQRSALLMNIQDDTAEFLAFQFLQRLFLLVGRGNKDNLF